MMKIREPKRWLAIAALVLLTSVFAVAQHGARPYAVEMVGATAVDVATEGTDGVMAGAIIATSRNLVSRSRRVVPLPNTFLLSAPPVWEVCSFALGSASPVSPSEKRKNLARLPEKGWRAFCRSRNFLFLTLTSRRERRYCCLFSAPQYPEQRDINHQRQTKENEAPIVM